LVNSFRLKLSTKYYALKMDFYQNELFSSLTKNDTSRALQLLDHVSNVNFVDINGETPLFLACNYGLDEIAIKLVEKGADINFRNPVYKTTYHWTPLGRALRYCNFTLAKYLVDHGANINSREGGMNPLLWFSWIGDLDNVKTCIGNNADINHANDEGVTPLILAAISGNEQVVTLLITSGAHVNHVSNNEVTALMNACIYGHEIIVRILLAAGANINVKNRLYGTPLERALVSHNYDIVKLLIEAGSEIDIHLSDSSYQQIMADVTKNKNMFILELFTNYINRGIYIDRDVLEFM